MKSKYYVHHVQYYITAIQNTCLAINAVSELPAVLATSGSSFMPLHVPASPPPLTSVPSASRAFLRTAQRG